MTSPRCTLRSTVSVKELIEACFAKNRSRTAPKRKSPAPSKDTSSQVRATSRPRPKVTGPGTGSARVMPAAVVDRTPSICLRVVASATSP